jgi:hypothetical protein
METQVCPAISPQVKVQSDLTWLIRYLHSDISCNLTVKSGDGFFVMLNGFTIR